MKFHVKNLFVIGLAVTLIVCAVEFASAQTFQFSVARASYGEDTEVTITVPEVRTRTENYTVVVPYTENVAQTYTVQVPYTEQVADEDGKLVPVTKMRKETRTRMVPITKTRKETRTREVSFNTMVTKTRATRFPPANATFAYASGEAISDEQLKTIAAKEIPILRLPPGQTLTELQRSVLKPDTVVLMLPAPEENTPETEEEAADAEDAPNAEQAEGGE